MSDFHTPVMLKEAVDLLNVQKGEWYVDCNLGGGGHTAEILKRGGRVIGIDLDAEAIQEVSKNRDMRLEKRDNGLRAFSDKLILVQGNFVEIENVVKEVSSQLRSSNNIHGVLFDLGLSSHQLDTDERGFSFMKDAPLDMRMDVSKPAATAADLVNGLHEKELAELFWKLGEESFSRVIAKKIVEERKKGKIETTKQLARIVEMVKRKEGRIHPATKVFQALRIAVNDELNNLKDALPEAFEVLAPGGRIVVITFHSLEDRIVKDSFKNLAVSQKARLVNDKPLEPSEEELSRNVRSRSAKMRVIERL